MRRSWWPLAAITLGNFMLLIDVTIVNTALPQVARGLDASFTSLQWVMDIYALALAALLMVAGSAADLFGRRRLYLVGLAVFAISSLACGLAPDAGVLIAARAVQGLGAAAMFATNTPLLMATYSGRDRGIAFGVWGGTSGAAAAVGPVLGGVLTEYVDWRAIFLVNLPLTAIAVWITVRSIDESRGVPGVRIDWPGAASFTVCAGGLTYGLMRGGEEGWADTGTVASLVVAAIALLAFAMVERGKRQPLLDLALLRRPTFAVLMAAALLLQAAAFPYLTYAGLWLQSVLGMSPVQAGLAVTPMAGVSLVVGAAGGRLLERVAPGRTLGGGLLLVGTGALVNAAMVTPDAGWTAFAPGLALAGLGIGLAMPVLVSAALGSAPPERAGMASGAVNTFRQLGYALGIAVLGTVFATRVRDMVDDSGSVPARAAGQAAEAISGGHADAVIAAAPPARADAARALVHESFAAGLDRICVIAGIAALAAGLLVLAVVRGGPGGPPRKPTTEKSPTEPVHA
ncbi:MFS transporter [Streptomyces malaysiensis subsp. malaysiensis]|uniref:MFS transporter n=1 Tax=Streptomyces TaxID=1883 RepID=UPI000BFC03C1|nr:MULTISPECIES: MFS transporter [Streptomyces]ATL84052.1 EmrB/QacA family drug resistance transporter [Streptomyces malaysiensis]MCD9594245.1 MFS transporter [Streptomyces sp. 8ZJF_21]QDL71942.1 MFS transporter [Streptomyces malaysiensis]